MEVEIAKEVGFCFGVRKAVDNLDNILEKNQDKYIYVTGPLIHNSEFLKKYENKNVDFSNNLDRVSENSVILIRAHGISDEERKKIMEKASETNSKVIDSSCPYVLRVHYFTKKMVNEGYHIVIIGDKDHPETRGYYLNVKDHCTVIKSSEEISMIPKVKKIAVFAQTTMNNQKFKEIAKDLLTEFDEVRVFMTICPPVLNRQKSVVELAKNVDLMVVLGGYNSSNTKKLKEICEKYTQAVHIQRIHELDLKILEGKKKVGIAAGTSTPDWIIDEAYQFLKNYSPQTVSA